jgi:hypothetical protein
VLDLLLSLLIAASSQALALTFDDITTVSHCCADVPHSYGGLSRVNFLVTGGPASSGYACIPN